jgi:hypothetical protein
VLILAGCGHGRISDFDPDGENTKSIVFGFVRVFQNGNDATQDSVVHFDSGAKMKLDKDGFVAAHVLHGHVAIKRIVLGGSDYEVQLQNLSIRSGEPSSKTYFGHVVVQVNSPPPSSADPTDRVSWTVQNNWKDASLQWNRVFGSDRKRFYSGMAEKTAPDRTPNRSIATDRQELTPGF